MEKKEGFKKGKKLIDLNKKFQPKSPVSTKQKWRPFGPFPCVIPPPLAPPSTSSVPARNLVFGELQPPPTTASGGAPAATDVTWPPRGLIAADNYGDISAFKTLPLLPTTPRKSSEIIPSQLAPSTMTIFYSGGVSAFHDISPGKAELVLEIAGNGKNEFIGGGGSDEEIERKRWKNNLLENPTCVYVKHENSTAPSSSSGSFYPPGAIAMARKATLARFLEKRKHRLIHGKTYIQIGKGPDLSL